MPVGGLTPFVKAIAGAYIVKVVYIKALMTACIVIKEHIKP